MAPCWATLPQRRKEVGMVVLQEQSVALGRCCCTDSRPSSGKGAAQWRSSGMGVCECPPAAGFLPTANPASLLSSGAGCCDVRLDADGVTQKNSAPQPVFSELIDCGFFTIDPRVVTALSIILVQKFTILLQPSNTNQDVFEHIVTEYVA